MADKELSTDYEVGSIVYDHDIPYLYIGSLYRKITIYEEHSFSRYEPAYYYVLLSQKPKPVHLYIELDDHLVDKRKTDEIIESLATGNRKCLCKKWKKKVDREYLIPGINTLEVYHSNVRGRYQKYHDKYMKTKDFDDGSSYTIGCKFEETELAEDATPVELDIGLMNLVHHFLHYHVAYREIDEYKDYRIVQDPKRPMNLSRCKRWHHY